MSHTNIYYLNEVTMKYSYYYIFAAAVLVSLAAPVNALAQQDAKSLQGISPAGQELQKELRLWHASANAAGDAFDDTRNFSTVNLGYANTNGDFHRSQTAKEINDFHLYAEGFIDLNKVLLWGDFKFNTTATKKSRFNASITDPYRGEPYYVADSGRVSNWHYQNYNLRFRASTRKIGGFTFGIEGTYEAQLAAKQRDPRTDTRYYELEVIPGITYSIGKFDHIGATLVYNNIKEESDMDNENAYVYQPYYELYGLGTSQESIGSGRTTNYFGNRWGFTAQYGHNAGPWNILTQVYWNKYVENVEISFTTPRKDGLTNMKTWGADVSLVHKGDAFTHLAKVAYKRQSIDGVQYLTQRNTSVDNAGWDVLHFDVRSTYKTDNVSLSYSLVKNRGDEYDWRGDLSAKYVSHSDDYLQPNSVKDNKNFYLDAAVKKNFVVGKKLANRLLVAINGGWKDGINGKYVYGGPNANDIIVTEMEPLDEAYLTADAWHLGADVTYSQLVKSDLKVSAYAKASFNYQHTSCDLFSHRSVAALTLGVNF